MEKKTASDMRLLLSSFEPEYPVIKKGYIARLIVNEKLPVPEIVRKIKNIVQAAEPDRQMHEECLSTNIYAFKRIVTKKVNYTRQWTDFLSLNQQTFDIPFKSRTAACTPVPIQENTPEVPAAAATDLTPDTTNEILSGPMLSDPPSPRRLRRDCDSCVAKQRTCANMLKENKHLRLKLKEQKIRHRQERKMFSLKTVNEKIRRKTQSANLWRAKCSMLKNQLEDTQKQKEMLQKSVKTFTTTEEHLKSYVEKNKTLRETIDMYKQKLKKSEKEKEILEKRYQRCAEETSIKLQQI